ncbi:MAG: LCP family protein [Thermomicrobiales bacterium]
MRASSLTSYPSGAAFIGAQPPMHQHLKWGSKPGRWPRRHPFLTLAVLLLVISVSGVVAIVSQALSSVTMLHAISTPPASFVMPAIEIDDQPLYPMAASPSASPIAEAATPVAATPIPAATPVATPSAESTPSPASSPQTTQVVDTSAARAAVEENGGDYGDSGGVIDSVKTSANGVSEIAEGAAAASGLSGVDLEPITIMMMGVDARDGDAIDIGVNSDVLAVVRLDPETGSCTMLNIPRDSRVDLPGYGLTKINHALAVGGIPYQQLVVENFLGITIDHYALIDFNGIISLVDAMGGVTVEITESFYLLGTTFEPGVRTLTGLEALRYSRYRGGADGDFGRIHRQQQILRALIEQAATQGPVSLVQNVLPQFENHVRTDLTAVQMVALGLHFRTSCTEESLVTETLSGTIATFWDPLYNVNLSYVVIDEADMRRKVEELLAT